MTTGQHQILKGLRPFEREDVPLYYDWNRDSEVLGAYVEPDHRTLDELLADFDIDGWRTNRMRCWIILGQDETVMGYGHAWEFDPFETHVEFGRILLPAFRGKGFGPDLLHMLIDQVFKDTNAHRAQSVTSCQNMPVQKNWGRLGLQPEARLRDYMRLNQKYVDCFLFCVLRPEWEAKHDDTNCPTTVGERGKS